LAGLGRLLSEDTMTPIPRPPKSVAEIAELPPIGSTLCLEFMRLRGGSLAAETLVYIARAAVRARESELHQLAMLALFGTPVESGTLVGGHCEGIIIRRAREFGFDEPADLADFRSDCLSRLVAAIHPGPAAKEYAEVRFFDFFHALCIDVARGLDLRRSTVRLAPGDAEGLETDWLESAANSSEDFAEETSIDRIIDSENKFRLHRAVLKLPERQRTAIQLRYFLGLPISGTGTRTVISKMKVSEPNVYKLLARAMRTLRNDPDLRGLWP
jgi:RNA polymerase sigma factor (sigma-70 family)